MTVGGNPNPDKLEPKAWNREGAKDAKEGKRIKDSLRDLCAFVEKFLPILKRTWFIHD
jgi:hypothetical protein